MLPLRLIRTSCYVLLATFTSLCMEPTFAVVEASKAKSVDGDSLGAAMEYDQQYRRVESAVRKAAHETDRRAAVDDVRKIATLRTALRKAGASVSSTLSARAGSIGNSATRLSAEQQDSKMLDSFQHRHQELVKLLDSLHQLEQQGAAYEAVGDKLGDLVAFFKEGVPKHSGISRKLANLPWQTAKASSRAPVVDVGEFRNQPTLSERKSKANLLKVGPTDDDLTETSDIQLSPSIRAQAAALDGNPVAIFNWVRNNIEFVPTYGSIQGSTATLSKGRGNAFDISSLLIALLRASNVPARYSYGTIEIPSGQLQDWVGGTANVLSALTLLSQGGIPNIAVTSGGAVTSVRLEHIWVEAWLDFAPSRGAVNRKPAVWLPMDAAFKQHSQTQGIDLANAAGLDGNSLVAAAASGATVDPVAGFVQNANQTGVLNLVDSYTDRADISIGLSPSTKIGDVLGTRSIVSRVVPILPGALPYKLVAQGPRYSSLPSSLQHQFIYSLYASSFDRDGDSPVWTFQESLPNLAGKSITLYFRPATQADSDAIRGFLPRPHSDGTPISPQEVPGSIPAVVNMTSELRVDGIKVQSGGTFRIGTELAGRGGFTRYDFSSNDLTDDDTLVAGQTTAIGLDTQGIDPQQFAALKSRLSGTRSQIELGNFSGITEDDLAADPLAADILSYFVALENDAFLAGRPSRVIDLPALSYGLFHAAVAPVKIVGGITVSARFAGLLMDVGHLRHLRVDIDGNSQNLVRYGRARGVAASAFEHLIPELYFVNRAQCGNAGQPICASGVSAVKLLATAESQGQKVFTISTSNKDQIEKLALDSETIDQIRDAVAAG